ncbi:MAG: Cyclic pyranopterin monophosphate synthase [Promethearchaeota archaeon]|nr:MAG: Cyclic pyranopterin monophosphate synthase [Candidatus Lokiarchaeota archaeon]
MNSINKNFIKRGKYQQKGINSKSQCLTCERKCIISEGKVGYCGTRLNFRGEIFTLVYGCIPAQSCNPIEKKPLYRFHPGTTAFTVGTYGCNFDCFWCQNWNLSHPSPSTLHLIKNCHTYLSPEDLVKKALEKGCQGTSISFNEPTLLFEYSLAVFKIAKQHGLYNTYVSNGYMTEQVLTDLIDQGLDAINIDVKGSPEMVNKYCGADMEKVWRNARILVEKGVHVEITTLLIENLNTDVTSIKTISKCIKEELGASTPYHLSRSFPRYKSEEYGFIKPTPLNLMHRALLLAKSEGLEWVYLGNV